MIGVVAVARHVTDKTLVVLKCMNCEKIVEKNLIANVELECLMHYELADTPYIMPLLKLIAREKELVMVFPYINGRDLYRFMRARKQPKQHLTEYHTQFVLKQLIQALKSVH